MKNDIVVKMEYGSHLYGLSTPQSDTDYKAIALPTAKQIIMQKADFDIKMSTGDQHGKNTNEDIDDEVMSLSKFLYQAMAGKNTAIDMLHAAPDQVMITSDIWKELQDKREMFYTKDMSSYVDYVQGQAAKYGVKGSRLAALKDAMDVLSKVVPADETKLGDIVDFLPVGEHAQIIEVDSKVGKQKFYEICQRKFDFTNKVDYCLTNMQKIYDGYGHRAKLAENNDGVDWKAVSHALRAGFQARAIYLHGGFSYPLAETDFILDVKKGKVDYKTGVQPAIEELVAEVNSLAKASTLPETSDKDYWENWLYQKHLQIIKDSL